MELRTFIITSDEFEGEIIAKFTEDTGVLMSISWEKALLSQKQHDWFLENIPYSISILNKWILEKRKLKVEEQKVTFDLFWSRYDHKESSSKKRALAKWNRMSAANQGKAYRYIGRYFASLQSPKYKKNAEKYLNDELWNN